MWDEALRFGEGRTHTLNFIWAEYGVVVPHNKKTPQPFSRFMIWAILTSIFYLKKRFRQQGGQHMLTKFFSSKQAPETEQKRLLSFVCISRRFLDKRIKPKIIEIITYKTIEHIKTFIVVTVPRINVIPCSAKNEK